MIRVENVTTDDVGFPIVRWTESRGAHSPEAFGNASVECCIRKHKDTRELLFVARGTVRNGTYEEGRPWKDIKGFTAVAADSLYHSPLEREMLSRLLQRSPSAAILVRDHAIVVL